MKLDGLKEILTLTIQIRRRNLELMSDILSKHDITYEQWIVLRVISEHDGTTQKIIADLAYKDKSTLTRILDQLENKKMIERKIDISDRRSFVLKITEKGESIAIQILPIEEDMYSVMLREITEEDINYIKDAFSKMLRNVDEQLRRE